VPLRRSGRFACRAPLALLLLGGCQRDYTFHTVGHYEAPTGHYEIAIDATGKVRAGSDLSDEATATVRITPAPGAAGDSLHLLIVLPDRLTWTLGRGARGSLPWAGAGAVDTLASLLRRAGYPDSPPVELREFYGAIEGALLGPKATLMEGQTTSLRVLGVTFTP
jgi:hypothetical protein